MSEARYLVGLDVGSTTVKAVVVEAATDRIVWSDYQRHETRQAEKALEFLQRLEGEIEGFRPDAARLFLTGSGGASVARHVGGRFVQEVNAVALAVEKLHPECGSVIELGGQDAKIIIFRDDPASGRKKKIPSMNDKCAGGTGAVIDKITAKLNLAPQQLASMRYRGLRLHPVAGKCGVFAETDINGLQKCGVPPDELMASLFEAIVLQNLTVLTRGNTLRPVVLLLGGPNRYIPGLRECWQHHIPKIWRERRVSLPEAVPPEELIRAPENAEYFAALGAVEFGRQQEDDSGVYFGCERLAWYVNGGREQEKAAGAAPALIGSRAELDHFRRRYSPPRFQTARLAPGQLVEAFIGLDGGSTSTKAVLVSAGPERSILAKAYQLSRGNPIEDAVAILQNLEEQVSSQGAILQVCGLGVTGYAKDILKDVLAADAAIVETVAHTQAGLHFFPDVDVICDVGGQDIKIIFLKNGRVKDFRLNTQCSAGNGYFLQSTAQAFGYRVEEFADTAFRADAYPEFGYGCAVFMQSDIVDFQRQGWRAEEIMAGLCAVLPKNIWLYVAQIPNLASLGQRFLLQGGTQYNLAAVKAQVDFIEARFKAEGRRPEVTVHPHCGEAGAIGAALEAARVIEQGRRTGFIGMAAVREIRYKTTRNEDTRCYFCKNNCLRTFIDVKTPVVSDPTRIPVRTKVPIEPGAQRVIIATCEKGTVEDLEQMRVIKDALDRVKEENPNFADIASRAVFRIPDLPLVADAPPRWTLTREQKARRQAIERRARLRIGIPRVLNMYSLAPLFTGYFVSLGIRAENIIFSEFTSDTLYREGAKRGAIDPCFPSKLGIPHVHNLIYVHHAKRTLDVIFFPMVDDLPSELAATVGCRACPTVTATPESVKAAFTKEGDVFREHGILFLDTFLNPAHPRMFERQLFRQFRDLLGLSPEENARAVAQGYAALERCRRELRRAAREALDRLEREDRIGIVVLGRPYHNDPGINHGLPEELQKLGYPIFTQDTLPTDEDILERLFGEEVGRGEIPHPMAITDVWKNSYSENTSRKLWAAKYVARHPNLAALELSSFKCGHDAPIYSVVEEIIEMSGTPYFCFKDIDENKPAGSIKIRIETIAYFLARYREELAARRQGRSTGQQELEEAARRRLAEKIAVLEADRKVRAAMERGAMPRIDVPLGNLAASAPAPQRLAAD